MGSFTKTFAVVALLFPLSVHAQSTDSATASGSTTIAAALAISKTSDLAFGRVLRPAVAGAGTVTIGSGSDVVNATAGAVALAGMATSRAKFTVNGEGGQAVTVTVPAQFTMTKGSDSIVVTLNSDTAGSVTLGSTTGTAAVHVGGSFSLPDDQASGAYAGSFTVTVAYQ